MVVEMGRIHLVRSVRLALLIALSSAALISCSDEEGTGLPAASPSPETATAVPTKSPIPFSMECPAETPIASAPGLPAGGMTGDLAVVFHSVEEISKSANAIVVVDIPSVSNENLSLSTETSASLPFTIAEAVVRESLAGDLAIGQRIIVGELGGPTRGTNKENPAQLAELRVMAPGGVLPLAGCKSYLLFLMGPTNIGPVKAGAYAPEGGFQGKFLLKDGVIEFEGSDALFTSGEPGYAVAKALDGRKWSEVRAEIVGILAKK